MEIFVDFARRMCSKRVTKWAGVFTLLVCCFACTGLAQDTNESAVDSPAKTPGEQLIDFMMNPPDKFDFGGMHVVYQNGTESTNYFRMKKDGEFLFDAIGESPIISGSPLGALKHYGFIWSRYGDEYWDLRGNQLTTWTNHHLIEEEKNPFSSLEQSSTGNVINHISLFFIASNKRPFHENKSLIVFKDKEGQILNRSDLVYDSQGYLIEQKTLLESPIKLYLKNVEKYCLGGILEYRYGTNRVPSFFPSEIHSFTIDKIIENKVEEIQTNKVHSYFFNHLDLSPTFNKVDFAVEPTATENYFERYWISGTNKVYIDKNSGTIQKVLSHKDYQKILDKRDKKQSKYRMFYVILIITFGFLIVILTIKTKKQL